MHTQAAHLQLLMACVGSGLQFSSDSCEVPPAELITLESSGVPLRARVFLLVLWVKFRLVAGGACCMTAVLHAPRQTKKPRTSSKSEQVRYAMQTVSRLGTQKHSKAGGQAVMQAQVHYAVIKQAHASINSRQMSKVRSTQYDQHSAGSPHWHHEVGELFHLVWGEGLRQQAVSTQVLTTHVVVDGVSRYTAAHVLLLLFACCCTN